MIDTKMASNSSNPPVKVGQQSPMAAPASPSAPKAMLVQMPRVKHLDAISLLELDFNQKFLLLSVLVDCCGPHVHREAQRDPERNNEVESRRDFLDKLAYLCDTEKGGGTVTADALQKIPEGNALWLAANEGISDAVMTFVEWTLDRLKEMTMENRKSIKNTIFEEAVKRAGNRISYYQSRLVKFANDCRKALGKFKKDEKVMKLCEWLEALNHLRRNDLVMTCYRARSKELLEIRTRIENPEDDFYELAHYVGRLGAHRHAVVVVAEAWLQVPSLQKIVRVRRVPPADTRRIELPTESLIPYNMVKAMCQRSEPNTARKCLHAFTDIDLKLDVQALMAERSSFVNRVHAELLIVEAFSRHKYEFGDDDKYVGCSKGACYFCCKWIVLHHKGLVRPASHNKVIIGCRGLDQDLNNVGAKHYKRMLEKMVGAVEQDIIRYLDGHMVVTHQHLSTNGSSRAPSTRA